MSPLCVTATTINENGLMVGADALIDPTLAEYGISASRGGLFTTSASNNVALRVKRSNDGTLVQFYSGITQEGVISVASGPTAGGGGIGAVTLFMRSSAAAASDFFGSDGAGAVRFSYVRSGGG